MSLKVLLIGDDQKALQIDKTYLVDRGLRVHTCLYTNIISDLIAEIKPDVIFINPIHSNDLTMDVYEMFLNDMNLLTVPVIYTLSEDDVYLVNRKRTGAKQKRNIITDNMIEAIKLALEPPQRQNISLPLTKKQHMPFNNGHAHRA